MRHFVPALGLSLTVAGVFAGEVDLVAKAQKTLRQATEFFRAKVAMHGGYLWRYSDDLARREGEGKATATMVWVQPPGTPSVGLAFLRAYQATGDKYYLEAAHDAALCLVRGQLHSGGWDYRIEFDSTKRREFAYRVEGAGPKGKNSTTLDDNNTQEAVRLLMRVDRALNFKDTKVHEAVTYALDCLLKAQYPNGAWPQRYQDFPEASKFPVKKAAFPESWSKTWPKKAYQSYYTLNDNVLADMVDILLEAERTYGQKKYLESAKKVGDFLILAQLPEPQPAWAQQYDADMHPAWARKFEPPAVTGGESHGAMRTLLRLYRETADKKYLEPIPRALAFFKKHSLGNGRLARFYELKTSKPLYFTKDYQLTYSDADMPTHYAFKISNGMDKIAREFEFVAQLYPAQLKALAKATATAGKPSAKVIEQVAKAIAWLDEQGRWVEAGKLRYHGADDPTQRLIACQTFIQNVNALSDYLAWAKK